MTISSLKARAIATVLGFVVVASVASGCNDRPTTVLVQNDYPAPGGAASAPPMTVFKVWWVTTLFPSPVAAGAVSESERTIPGTDFAYALVAPDWSADSGTAPSRLIALKSTRELTASAHDVLTISVSDRTFAGNCAAGSALSADDAALAIQRIFPGEFVGLRYDPATCTTTPAAADSGASDNADAGQVRDAAAD